jgi:hypothetical protein
MALRGKKACPAPSNPDRPNNLRDLAGRLGIPYDRARKLQQDRLSIHTDGTYDIREAMEFDRARRARTPGLESEAARTWNDRLKKAPALQAERDLAISLNLWIDIEGETILEDAPRAD